MRWVTRILLFSIGVAPTIALAQASSTEEINRALGFDNRGRSNLLPSTGGSSAAGAQGLSRRTAAPSSSYVRTLLDYDIPAECRKHIYSLSGAIADGSVNPTTAVPNCIEKDTAALSKLDASWSTIPSQKREQCLAAFGRALNGKWAFHYLTIAQCTGVMSF